MLVIDAVIISGMTGLNYVVFGAGLHQPEEVEVVLKRLTGAGISLDGSIFNFNRAQSSKTLHGHYYRYHYNYSYYYDHAAEVKA